MRLHFEDYRYAEAVLEHANFKSAKQEVLDILTKASAPLLDAENHNPKSGGVKKRGRKVLRGSSAARYFFLPVDQKALNKYLDNEFSKYGWETQPRIVSKSRAGGPETGLKGDYKKGRLQIEAQFGNMARWYSDVFKFQLSYSLDSIDVAILIVPMQKFANLIDENVACFERVARELPWAKMSLTLPIWIIGIEPEDYSPLKKAYDRAFDILASSESKPIDKIPFDDRITEVSSLMDDSENTSDPRAKS